MLNLGLGLNIYNNGGLGTPPVNTIAPAITGTLEVGEVLTCSTGTWTGTTPITYSYQWKRGVTNIGTDSANYTAVYADIDQNITCTVTATNAVGNASQVSNTVVILVTIPAIVNNYTTLNAWSAENLTVVSTTTTLLDYKAVHDLINPAAANQPTFNAINANFNNKSTLTYITDDYNYKAFADYLIGQSTGSMHFAFRTAADVTTTSYIFGSGEEAAAVKYVAAAISSGKFYFLIQNSTTVSDRYQVYANTTSLLANTNYVVSVLQNGTALKIYINGVLQTLVVTTGSASTYWIGNVSGRVNITIGALIRSTTTYSNYQNAFLQITSDSADATVLANHNAIKSYYGI